MRHVETHASQSTSSSLPPSILLQASLPSVPGGLTMDMGPTGMMQVHRLCQSRLWPLANPNYKIPSWVALKSSFATHLDSESLPNIRSALQLLSSSGLKDPLSVEDRKTHFIFQSFGVSTVRNLKATFEKVLSDSSLVDMPNVKDFKLIMGRMGGVFKNALEISLAEASGRIGKNLKPVVFDGDDVIQDYSQVDKNIVLRLPSSISKSKNFKSKFVKDKSFRAKLAGWKNVKALYQEMRSVFAKVNAFSDISSRSDKKIEGEFMKQLAELINDLDGFAKLTGFSLEQIKTAREAQDLANFTFSRPSSQQSTGKSKKVEYADLAKNHDLAISPSSPSEEEAWLQALLLLKNEPGNIKPVNLELIKDPVAMDAAYKLTSFASLEDLLGMEAASLQVYAQLKIWLHLLTKPELIARAIQADLEDSAASEMRDVPSAYLYFLDRMLASFCSGLDAEYADVIFGMFAKCDDVDIDRLRSCYESPKAWLKAREYVFKKPHHAPQFDETEAVPLWLTSATSKKRQQRLLLALDKNNRSTLNLREKEIIARIL